MHNLDYLWLAIVALLVVAGIAATVRARRAWQRQQAQLKRSKIADRLGAGSPADVARRVC
jgi:cytochrome c-type biogenesis protein CcmH/NrfF